MILIDRLCAHRVALTCSNYDEPREAQVGSRFGVEGLISRSIRRRTRGRVGSNCSRENKRGTGPGKRSRNRHPDPIHQRRVLFFRRTRHTARVVNSDTRLARGVAGSIVKTRHRPGTCGRSPPISYTRTINTPRKDMVQPAWPIRPPSREDEGTMPANPGTTNPLLLLRLADWRDHPAWGEFFAQDAPLVPLAVPPVPLDEDAIEDACQRIWIGLSHRLLAFRYEPNGSFRGGCVDIATPDSSTCTGCERSYAMSRSTRHSARTASRRPAVEGRPTTTRRRHRTPSTPDPGGRDSRPRPPPGPCRDLGRLLARRRRGSEHPRGGGNAGKELRGDFRRPETGEADAP